MECVGGRVLIVISVLLTLVDAATLPSKPTADKAQQFVDKCRSHCIVQVSLLVAGLDDIGHCVNL